MFLDKYEGIRLNDFDVSTVKGREVLRCRFRVLKRGGRKRICANCGARNSTKANFCGKCGASLDGVKFDSRLKKHYVWDSIRLEDPFSYYIVEWLDFLKQNSKERNPRVWAITRQRAWQICKRLGIMNHTQRHWRATQLADAMDPFTLKEALHRAKLCHLNTCTELKKAVDWSKRRKQTISGLNIAYLIVAARGNIFYT